MKNWIYAAFWLLVLGMLFPMSRGDGAGMAEGMIGGLGVLFIVLMIAAVTWLVKISFKIFSPPKSLERAVDPARNPVGSSNRSPDAVTFPDQMDDEKVRRLHAEELIKRGYDSKGWKDATVTTMRRELRQWLDPIKCPSE